MSEQSQSGGAGVIVGVLIFSIALIGMVYANVTGILQISGAALVGQNTATAAVVVLFLIFGVYFYTSILN